MRIKKHNNGNEYLLTPQNMWVRNFNKLVVPYADINQTINSKDHFLFLKNEIQNNRGRYPWIDTEQLIHEKIVIISDGYNFEKKHKVLASLPKDVSIIGVHGALAKWKIVSRGMTYYVVNNPYQECMFYLPKRNKSLPRCIASNRTNYQFLSAYNGIKYRYCSVNEEIYCGIKSKEIEYQVDDYRNPICAAICLAYHFGVEKLLLFCCDDVFESERPGAEKLYNELWMYPQQRIAHSLIDGNLYWLKSAPYQEVTIKDHSSGPLYNNAEYINEDKILSFFEDGNE